MSIGLEVGKVTLSSYDNEWVKNFEEEKKNLKVEDLLAKFSIAGEVNDRMILG